MLPQGRHWSDSETLAKIDLRAPVIEVRTKSLERSPGRSAAKALSHDTIRTALDVARLGESLGFTGLSGILAAYIFQAAQEQST